MIDLHSHTWESDGTFSPRDLVLEAKAIGLEALAITDHDTFKGYDAARPVAEQQGLDLVCGIELSTKLHGKSVHLLGYFPVSPPTAEFRGWITGLQESRNDRNRRLAERLQSLGIDITLDEIRAKGRSLAGRPHFARVLVEKGYAATMQQAFDEYLDESAKAYVERDEADFGDAVSRIVAGGGIPSLAHPIRLVKLPPLGTALAEMRDVGLLAMEVFHSDHRPANVEEYRGLASRYGLAMTGGSDFHGANKPGIQLGKGADGSLHVPLGLLTKLRELLQ